MQWVSGVNRPGNGFNYSLPPSANAKNERSYTSSSLYVLMAWTEGNFPFYSIENSSIYGVFFCLLLITFGTEHNLRVSNITVKNTVNFFQWDFEFPNFSMRGRKVTAGKFNFM
jgi:hypothetical protein